MASETSDSAEAVGMESEGSLGHGEVPPSWNVYFSVPDCDASVKRVEELGGRCIVSAQDIPPGRFAVVTDPAGAVFTVMYVRAPD